VGRARVTWHADRVADQMEARLLRNGDATGEALAERISGRAPRKTGYAAEHVGHQVRAIPDGVRITVGYEKSAFYMVFSEVGTSHQAASPTVLPTVLESKDLILRTLTRG
jgi:HK97 gp10 family phage protein